MKKLKTYSELRLLPTFKERFEYLKLKGYVGEETFGHNRHINQLFYKSKDWQNVRRDVIVRDCGLDLGVIGREIQGKILVHHMNPISIDDILQRNELVLNPEYLISISHSTHNAITYGSEYFETTYEERYSGDTKLW